MYHESKDESENQRWQEEIETLPRTPLGKTSTGPD
jgi:hypothetical protein